MCSNVEKLLKLSGIRVKSDMSEQETPGWKYNEWEMKGVPLRIEIGPKDVAKNAVVFARRDKPGKEGKQFGIPVDEVGTTAVNWLEDIQNSILQKAILFRDSNIIDVTNLEEFKLVIESGKWVRAAWAGTSEMEKILKDQTGATLRCFPLDQPSEIGNCFYTGVKANEIALFAKSY
jgi:prolyl-tRNA synthetase